MVIQRPSVALEALGVLQGVHYPLDHLVLDLAIRLVRRAHQPQSQSQRYLRRRGRRPGHHLCTRIGLPADLCLIDELPPRQSQGYVLAPPEVEQLATLIRTSLGRQSFSLPMIAF
ncbi:hypothetical protein [Pseudomonas sp. MWU12-2345]|uniref:hypothetical protein n=1 Tax=Pseudomonas sp. MWU12-2345 TaxID=2928689 RepID=UPI00200FB512|nr:hypothetical protein [Pseudomonas sp. MWU12-2345]